MRSSAADSAQLAQDDHPFYQRVDELLVTDEQAVTGRLPCERIMLPRAERWPSHHISGHVVRTGDGRLHALLGGEATMLWHSADDGRTWEGEDLDIWGAGGLAALPDDGLLLVHGGGERPIGIQRSGDGGVTWESIGTIDHGFPIGHIDSGLVPMRNGDLQLAINVRIEQPADTPLADTYSAQYLLRSTDGGLSWTDGVDREAWEEIRAGTFELNVEGPEFTWPGEGGTFDGVYETGFHHLQDGRLLGAFRMSGPPRAWHAEAIADWGEPPVTADGHGRLFRHIGIGESADEGRSWTNLHPVVDAAGRPLLAHGECNGELVQLSDGRVVLIHQTRYAEAPERAKGWFRGRSQLCARISDDGGATWRPERWRLLFGFGYPGSLVLADDTIVTVVGACLGDNGDPRRAAVVRWRPDDLTAWEG